MGQGSHVIWAPNYEHTFDFFLRKINGVFRADHVIWLTIYTLNFWLLTLLYCDSQLDSSHSLIFLSQKATRSSRNIQWAHVYGMRVLSSHALPICRKPSYNLRLFVKTRKKQTTCVLVLGVKYCINIYIYIYIYIYILSSSDRLFRSIRTLQCG